MKWARCKPAWGDDRGSTLYSTMGNNNKNSPLTDKHRRHKIYVENNKHWNPPGLRKQDVFVPLLCLLLSEWVRSVNERVGDWAACWEVTFSNFCIRYLSCLSFILRFSDFPWWLVGRFGVLANVLRCRAAAFEQLTCRNAMELHGGGAWIGSGARAA